MIDADDPRATKLRTLSLALMRMLMAEGLDPRALLLSVSFSDGVAVTATAVDEGFAGLEAIIQMAAHSIPEWANAIGKADPSKVN